MGLLDSVDSIAGGAVNGLVDSAEALGGHLAEDGYKLATDSHYREQTWNSVVNDAKAAANSVATAFRTGDAAKEQLGSWIDSGEKYLEKKVDDGRAWLRQNGGVLGQETSDQIGLVEGVGVSLYDAGKGLVQLANGVQSLTNPIEWATNPGADIARVKSTVNTVGTLGKLAGLADPASWMADAQGNAQLAGALWHSAATSFNKDPAKFTGNLLGTIGTLFIPGAEGAGAVADAAKMTELATDASKAATITADVSKAAAITEDASKAATITEDASRAATITEDTSRVAAATGDVSKAGALGSRLAPAAPKSYGVAFFGDSNLHYYNVAGAKLGAPGRSFFLMPLEDSVVVKDAASAARYTGMTPSTLQAYKAGGDIYGIVFPTEGMALRMPTSADAGGWAHFLEGGRTAVQTEGPNAGYLLNPTREFVTPGGNQVPSGSVLFQLGPNGAWAPLRKF